MIRIFFSLITLFLLSCNEVEPLYVNGNYSSDSPLNISTSTVVITKGELVYEPEDMGSIGLYCAMTGDEEWSSETIFSKMNDRRYYISDDGDWKLEGDSESWGYTSLSDKYTFFAYSPHCEDTKGVTPYIKDGELVIDYIVPSSSIDQPDLMYAAPCKDINAQVESGVPLDFYHALSSVSFSVISTNGEKIVAIDISGVVSEGSLRWDYDSNLPTWSLSNLTTDSLSVEIEDYIPSIETSTQVNTDRGYLMMIPQVLTSGAQVLLTFDTGEQSTLTIPADVEWVAGSKYNYIIRFDEMQSDFIFDSTEISNCYIINPTVGEQTIVQIPIEDRINDFWNNYSGKGSKKIKTATTTKELSVEMIWEDFDDDFKFEYLVLDDSDNKMAVLFTVPAKFQEGNFVFAVNLIDEDGYESILWSWHLWFTDYNPDAIAAVNKYAIEDGIDKEYKRTGYEGTVHRYKDISDTLLVWDGIYKDKFIMDRNIGERNEYAENYGAGSVYYQFGRKDPFPGISARYESSKQTRPNARSSSGFSFYNSVEYAPDFFISASSSSDNWSSEDAARSAACIWFDENISTSGYSEGKSIFDPSPLGWRVPVSGTWSSFNLTGLAQIKSDSTKSVGVYNFYGCTKPDEKGAILSGVDEVGYVWSANPSDSETGFCLYTSDSLVVSPSCKIMTYGFPVRAVQE